VLNNQITHISILFTCLWLEKIAKAEFFDIIKLQRNTSVSFGINEHFKERYSLFPEDVMSNVAKI